MNRTSTTNVVLEPLSQSSLTVGIEAEDIRGRAVYDRHDDEVRTVTDLIIDRGESKVRFIQLGAGGFLGIGEDTFLIPVDAITGIDAEGVHIDKTREHVAGGPTYQPDLVAKAGCYGDVYAYYGYAPYWGAGYAYPAYPYLPPSLTGPRAARISTRGPLPQSSAEDRRPDVHPTPNDRRPCGVDGV